MSFWSDLRQRRIIQVLITYLGGGWLGLEAITQLVENNVVPPLTYQLALVVFLTGVPAALILGWYHGEKGHQRAKPLELLLLGICAVGGVAAGAAVISAHQSDEQFASVSELDANRLAVMYLDAPGDELRPVADGLTEALIDQLRQVESLDVVSENGSAQFRDSDLSPDSIARALDAGTLIEGSLQRSGSDLAATIQLLDGGSGTVFNSQRFEWPEDSVLAAREALARQVSSLLREWLGREVEVRERRAGTESVSAWVLVQQGDRALEGAQGALQHGDVHAAETAFARADSLFARAEAADSAWAEPTLLRARVAYEQSRYREDPLAADEYMQEALGHLDRAMAKDARNADAYALRGTIRYVRWLLALEPDPRAADRLLQSAEEDLRQATRLDPRQVDAWNVLAHLYNQQDDIIEANNAARQAVEADAYHQATAENMWRLFHTSYDMEGFVQAQKWCEEGQRRFPENPRFVECQLWLMTTRVVENPSPDRAWALADRLVELTPEQSREPTRIHAHILVAAALARADLADSARSVLDRSRPPPEIDPNRELLLEEAFARTLLGDEDEAVQLIREYLAVNPERRRGFAEHGMWWWRPLQDNPDFQRMIGAS